MVKCRDGTFYTGVAKNLAERIHAHNYLKSGAKYTRARRPVRLVYKEVKRGRGRALSREAAIKRLKRSEKEFLIKPLGKSQI